MPSPEGPSPQPETNGTTGPDIVLPLVTSESHTERAAAAADRRRPVEVNPDSFAAAKAMQRAEAASAAGFGGSSEAMRRELDAQDRARRIEQARQDALAAANPDLITSVPGGRLTAEAAAVQHSEWAPRTPAQATAAETARDAVSQAHDRDDLDNTRERVREVKIPRWERGVPVAVRRSPKSGGGVELDWTVDSMSPDGKKVLVTKPAENGMRYEKELGIYDLAATQPEFTPGTVVNAQVRGAEDGGWRVSSQESNGEVTIVKGVEGSDRAHILHLPAAELAQWQQPEATSDTERPAQ